MRQLLACSASRRRTQPRSDGCGDEEVEEAALATGEDGSSPTYWLHVGADVSSCVATCDASALCAGWRLERASDAPKRRFAPPTGDSNAVPALSRQLQVRLGLEPPPISPMVTMIARCA